MHNFLQKKAKEKKENKKVKIYIHRGELVGQRFPSPSSASSPPMASTTRGECENTGSASLQQQRAAGRARATSPRQEEGEREGTQPVRPCCAQSSELPPAQSASHLPAAKGKGSPRWSRRVPWRRCSRAISAKGARNGSLMLSTTLPRQRKKKWERLCLVLKFLSLNLTIYLSH